MMNVILVAGFPRRRESIAKIHSMTIEAPITKVRQEVYVQEIKSAPNCPTFL